MSFKAYMLLRGEEPKTNGLAFATREEADAYGRDLFSRWKQSTGHETRESDEPVNYAWVDGRAILASAVAADNPQNGGPMHANLLQTASKLGDY